MTTDYKVKLKRFKWGCHNGKFWPNECPKFKPDATHCRTKIKNYELE